MLMAGALFLLGSKVVSRIEMMWEKRVNNSVDDFSEFVKIELIFKQEVLRQNFQYWQL
jgi:hypothetical protein